LAEIVSAVPGAVTLDGTAVQEAEGWRVDVDGTGPYGAVLDLAARLPEAGPEIAAEIRIPDAGALDSRLTGALIVDLDARQLDGVWQADLDASGPLDASLTAEATLGEDEANVVADLRIPDSSVLTPRLSGPLNVDLDATQVSGTWTVDFDASGPLGASAVGEARLAGQDAEIDFDLRVPDSSVLTPQLNGPLNADVSARQVDGVWTVEADSRGPFGGTIQANARLDGSEADVNATVALPDISRAVPQLNGPLNATIAATQRDGVWSADIDAGGPLGATLDVSGVVFGGPVDVAVDLSVPDISPLVPDLSGPLGVSGNVTQAGEAYSLDLDLTGPSGTQASVSGTAAPDLTLDLSVSGSAPLGLANPFLEPQRLDGTVSFDLDVAGPPALDSVSGTVSTQGAALVLPTLRNELDPVNATVTIAGGQANVQATAGLASGGEVQINGPVALTAPFDADLDVTFDVTVEDPSLYTAEAQGSLTITGPLTGGAVIGGEIVIPEAEIAVPSTGITAIGDLPPIDHLGATRPVQRTLARAGQDAASLAEEQAEAASAGPGFTLDLVIRAPGRIFVRGRGLDAELGGEIFLTGTTNQVITAGGFELIRGRLDILQQRFLFDEGRVTFQGDLVPYVRLVAETETDTLTAFIVVEGPVDDIAVRFDSSPEVPQEEVLAQIFFGRDLTELSPLQALQLANSVAVLAGRGSGSLLETLRAGAGLDDLDVTTDAEGNTAVRAGKYISDNVYTTVQIDQSGEAEISLNLDVSPNLTIRGTTGAAGESTVGVFFERDY
jgi:translocation and assembly module TamB